MKPTSQGRCSHLPGSAALLVALAVVALVPWVAAAQQSQPQYQVALVGNSCFRWLLNAYQLTPLHQIDDLRHQDAKEVIVIAFGDLHCLDEVKTVTGGLKNFVDSGGALFIASDRDDAHRLADFNVRINGNLPVVGSARRLGGDRLDVLLANKDGEQKRVGRNEWEQGQDKVFQDWHLVPAVQVNFPDDDRNYLVPKSLWDRREAELYQRFADCLLVKNHIGLSHPLFISCGRGIVTNKPSFIKREPISDCVLLCAFPPFPPAIDHNGIVLYDQAFAVGSGANPGSAQRLLILSGHSVFMDGMLAQPDTDNIQFTINTVHWLSHHKKQKRKYALFLHEGHIVDKFNVPIGELPMPTSRIINNLLRKLEEQNFFNQLLLEGVDRHDPSMAKLKILRVLLLASVAGLGGYGLMRYRKARHFLEVSVPLVEAKLAQTVTEFVPTLVKRDKLALSGNDFREAARTLAQLCFEQSPGGQRSSLPPRVADPARDRAGLTRVVNRLWDLAYGEPNQPVPADDFARLVALVRQVQEALARGTLRWAAQP